MTARVLVVDDVASNVKLLESRLMAEYFDVVCAYSGAEALKICADGKVDVVLLDVMMPEMDGFEVCSRLKSDNATQHIPVVMLTTLGETPDRVRGLQAGADDFLSKPVDDLQLVTRVKSLVRLKMLTDELRLRTETIDNLGFAPGLEGDRRGLPTVLLIDEDARSSAAISGMLQERFSLDVEDDPQAGLFRAAEGGYECVLVTSSYASYDPLRLCAQLRALDRTRLLPVMLVVDRNEETLISRALELGVNDYIVRPIDEQELQARLRTQLRRKRYNDRLRSSVSQSFRMAVTDPLTGLYNRRYLDTHLPKLLARAVARRRPLSVMMVDIDRFKVINDRWGHPSGDDVLREFADRLRQNIRGIDLICRFGGEEFVVVMPDTERDMAEKVAERLRAAIASEPFTVDRGKNAIAVTTSVGVVGCRNGNVDPAELIKRADIALYDAKSKGRNRVVASAA
ncbi:PleD family two-component system response regulator [Nitratireductor kimnyeongensis]|uniref:diguanylate cyclase n=1 Tax=Nitratireductor kimnyeongensis TaxID=430679 RepID=A0ABW0TAY2_9HYPH|nr:PleD family two-component system response regulator [Nitratireductor kimnyeongensis]QZZ35726.1 PleD family two-component system response regulator [Nitratireductor kimnyeongensis]